MKKLVVDSHIHLVTPSVQYREAVTGLLEGTSSKLGKPLADFDESDYLSAAGEAVEVKAAVFVEVIPEASSSVQEACWILDKIADPSSRVRALVASVPVPEGAEAVAEWLAALRERRHGQPPAGLRGARMQFPQGEAGDVAIRSDAFAAGLEELGKHGLHFEFCVHADRLPAVVDAARRCPSVQLVLDHCGLNDSGQDFAAWQANITALAACRNVVVKLSAIEEWQPVNGDPAPYLDHALACFGPDRCMFGGNWFVPIVFAKPYSRTVELVTAALQRMGASEEQQAMVWAGTASRFYKLELN